MSEISWPSEITCAHGQLHCWTFFLISRINFLHPHSHYSATFKHSHWLYFLKLFFKNFFYYFPPHSFQFIGKLFQGRCPCTGPNAPAKPSWELSRAILFQILQTNTPVALTGILFVSAVTASLRWLLLHLWATCLALSRPISAKPLPAGWSVLLISAFDFFSICQ